jgi:hypothetical protein
MLRRPGCGAVRRAAVTASRVRWGRQVGNELARRAGTAVGLASPAGGGSAPAVGGMVCRDGAAAERRGPVGRRREGRRRRAGRRGVFRGTRRRIVRHVRRRRPAVRATRSGRWGGRHGRRRGRRGRGGVTPAAGVVEGWRHGNRWCGTAARRAAGTGGGVGGATSHAADAAYRAQQITRRRITRWARLPTRRDPRSRETAPAPVGASD